jgi:hypothetical protein
MHRSREDASPTTLKRNQVGSGVGELGSNGTVAAIHLCAQLEQR